MHLCHIYFLFIFNLDQGVSFAKKVLSSKNGHILKTQCITQEVKTMSFPVLLGGGEGDQVERMCLVNFGAGAYYEEQSLLSL